MFDGWNPRPRDAPTKVRVGVTPALFVLQLMDTGRNPAWEQDGHTSVRACCQEEDGGAPGPSTSKGEWDLVPKEPDKLSTFLCYRMLGQAMR